MLYLKKGKKKERSWNYNVKRLKKQIKKRDILKRSNKFNWDKLPD